VVMGFIDQGKVYSSLRYSPPEPTDAIKTGKLYKLSRVTTRMPLYGADGKTVRRQSTCFGGHQLTPEVRKIVSKAKARS